MYKHLNLKLENDTSNCHVKLKYTALIYVFSC